MAIFESLKSLVLTVGPFFLLLGLLIFVHELGHFLVAKYFGVRVETFSLGFGKKLLSVKRGDTTYALSMIPLGGYVKMYGDDPTADVPSEERKYAFLHKPVMQRIWIVLAGPLMNLFFAIVLFTAIAGLGEETPGPFVGDVAEKTAAFTAGFRSGDRIKSINGEETPTWSHVKKILEVSGGRAVTFSVERAGDPPLEVPAAVTFGENENIFSSTRQVGQLEGLTPESRSSIVGVRDAKTPAGLAGVQSLDLIVSIGDKKVNYWRELSPILREAAKAGDTITLGLRDVNLPEKPETLKTVSVTVPKGWDESTDMAAYLGLEPAELYIFRISKDSPAEKAGIQVKDKVVKIGGEPVQAWNDVLTKVKGFDPTTDGLDFTVVRNGEEKTFKIKPEMTKLMNPNKGQEEKRFTIGIVSGFFPSGPENVFHRISNPVAMLKEGLADTAQWTEFVVMSLVRLVQGDVSPKNIGGVITIGRVASHSFAAGLSTFAKTMAIISINLFLLILLPIPILDGGHLVFYTIEGLRGAPLSMKNMETAQQVGLILLMSLMVFAFYNDISNLFFSRL